jgi:hypothetical protein
LRQSTIGFCCCGNIDAILQNLWSISFTVP